MIFILFLITFSSPEPLGLISNERVYPSFQHHVTWDENNYVIVLETSKRAYSHKRRYRSQTLLSHCCVFVWTGKRYSKTQRVVEGLKWEEKISIFKQKRVRVDGALIELEAILQSRMCFPILFLIFNTRSFPTLISCGENIIISIF